MCELLQCSMRVSSAQMQPCKIIPRPQQQRVESNGVFVQPHSLNILPLLVLQQHCKTNTCANVVAVQHQCLCVMLLRNSHLAVDLMAQTGKVEVTVGLPDIQGQRRDIVCVCIVESLGAFVQEHGQIEVCSGVEGLQRHRRPQVQQRLVNHVEGVPRKQQAEIRMCVQMLSCQSHSINTMSHKAHATHTVDGDGAPVVAESDNMRALAGLIDHGHVVVDVGKMEGWGVVAWQRGLGGVLALRECIKLESPLVVEESLLGPVQRLQQHGKVCAHHCVAGVPPQCLDVLPMCCALNPSHLRKNSTLMAPRANASKRSRRGPTR